MDVLRSPTMSPHLQRMRTLADTWGAQDRRSIFANAYASMTTNMVAAIDACEFADNDWVATLLQRFADYYFEAVDVYDRSWDECPVVWQQAFDACRQEDLHPLRVLFLGINAHINYDLAFTLTDVLDDWPDMDEGVREQRLRDHERVNDVIERTVDRVQTDVVYAIAPEMEFVDRIMGPVDEWVFSSLIAGWRGDVWTDAVALLEAAPEDRPSVAHHIERRALRVADQVVTIGPN